MMEINFGPLGRILDASLRHYIIILKLATSRMIGQKMTC